LISKCLIIIPAWNEEKALPVAISDLKAHQPDLDVLVIDDGSRDSTSAKAKSLGCSVVTLPLNLGIGGAVQTGLVYAHRNDYDYAIQFDADGQHLASEITTILDPVRNGRSDAVIGSRFLTPDGFKSSAARRAYQY
jgi:glycosyltransferase involved in cell wall biosynthesis